MSCLSLIREGNTQVTAFHNGIICHHKYTTVIYNETMVSRSGPLTFTRRGEVMAREMGRRGQKGDGEERAEGGVSGRPADFMWKTQHILLAMNGQI